MKGKGKEDEGPWGPKACQGCYDGILCRSATPTKILYNKIYKYTSIIALGIMVILSCPLSTLTRTLITAQIKI
jgi:hypothetical protein